MTREGNGDMEADEFPRKRMRQPCAVYNSHTWKAGAEVPGGVPGGNCQCWVFSALGRVYLSSFTMPATVALNI